MKYEPLLLSNGPLLDAYWPLAAPLLAKCVGRATHGEYDVDDLDVMAKSGKLFVFVVCNDKTGKDPDRDVSLALAVEVVNYPKLPALNILALGGRDLDKAFKEFWPSFTGWAYMNGVHVIEGWVDPVMQRVTTSMGFEPVYTHMRYDLRTKNG